MASGSVLALNSGSSSLKFGLYRHRGEDEELLLQGSAQGVGRDTGRIEIRSGNDDRLFAQNHVLESQTDALATLARALRDHVDLEPVAVGHRIVHGGPRLLEHQPLTAAVISELRAAKHFAPLHIPQALKLVQQAQQEFPNALQIACFDTAFHRTMPEAATHFPLPEPYFAQGVRRYGFHGLSYESLVQRLGAQLPRRAVFAHLGSGCSVAAVLDGKSIDTSMGMTPTGGVPMSTRTGDLDPGVLLYLLRTEHFDCDAVEDLVNRHSGLAGLSCGESDMQVLLARADRRDSAAELAIDVFCIGIRKAIGAYAALMGGIDLLVFTGGIGEHSERIRRQICAGLEFLGLDADESTTARVKSMPSEEERQIARHCRALISEQTKHSTKGNSESR